MIRLLRWAFWLGATFAVVYFAATVPLGQKTLLGHLHAIFQTREAKDLAEGTRDKAEEVAGKVRRELSDDAQPQQQQPARPAQRPRWQVDRERPNVPDRRPIPGPRLGTPPPEAPAAE